MKLFPIQVIAAVLCVGILSGCGAPAGDFAAARPKYPEMAPYPDETKFIKSNGAFDSEGYDKVWAAWWDSMQRQKNQPTGYSEGMETYLKKTAACFLQGKAGENRVYSPLNVYLALAMLAESTGTDTRQEILELLGKEDVESLREQVRILWNANYCDDGATVSLLANSLWLDNSLKYQPSTVDLLAKDYYASVFSGEMGSEGLNQALRDWINRQTGGLLEDQASDLELDPKTVLALASTIYFRSKWNQEFWKEDTAERIFTAADGSRQTVDFMNRSDGGTYYRAEHFGAVFQNLQSGGRMWFLLPDEGTSPEQLASRAEAMELLLHPEQWENQEFLTVNFAVPKFDVASDISLSDGLKALGVKTVFEADQADFSPILDGSGEAFLSQADHAARVTIDEEGVAAAAYTVMAACGACLPPEEQIDFILDRPFLFAITGGENLPLFIGIVNRLQ